MLPLWVSRMRKRKGRSASKVGMKGALRTADLPSMMTAVAAAASMGNSAILLCALGSGNMECSEGSGPEASKV